MPSFQIRTDEDELMDDFSITDERLTRALEQLRLVNQWLGGYRTTMRAIAPFLRSRAGQRTRLLDLGTGIADFPEHIVCWGAAQSPALDIEIVAVDANPATATYARETLHQRLPPDLSAKVQVEVADALALPYADQSFDIAMGAMFLHHFGPALATTIVHDMARVARHGVVINDLHRHPLAYYGIYSLTHLLPAAPMMRHDGPLSVLRGFTGPELTAIAENAGLQNFSLGWYFPFRWLLTTVNA
jgi:ubiquinone/menaquinone biosynthesis C-methylase UbiE